MKTLAISCSPSTPPTIGQRTDGSWYWLDETYNEGDEVRYATEVEASAAQTRYCQEVLGELSDEELATLEALTRPHTRGAGVA